MKRNWIGAWVFTLIFAGTSIFSAQASEYKITVIGKDLAEVNQVKNCIDYTVCEFASSAFTRDVAQAFMSIRVNLGPSELEQVYRSCIYPEHRFFIHVENVNGDVHPSLHPTLYDLVSKPWDGGSPVYLKTFSKTENNRIQKRIEKSIRKKQYLEAITYAAQAYQIDFNGFKPRYNPSEKEKEYAITDYSDRSIRFGKSFFSDPCSLVVAIRHEAEHTFQTQRESMCQMLGHASAFQYHLYRERSAYLNDILNLHRYCDNSSVIHTQETFRYQYLFDHYGANASLN